MYQRILVGTDGSSTAAKAVDRAVAVAALSKASLTIFSAGATAKAAAVVQAEATRHAAAGIAIDTVTTSGDAVTGLVDTAVAGGHDLLVVGNKGMTGLTRFFHLGSVPNKLTHHLPASLLIVRTT